MPESNQTTPEQSAKEAGISTETAQKGTLLSEDQLADKEKYINEHALTTEEDRELILDPYEKIDATTEDGRQQWTDYINKLLDTNERVQEATLTVDSPAQVEQLLQRLNITDDERTTMLDSMKTIPENVPGTKFSLVFYHGQDGKLHTSPILPEAHFIEEEQPKAELTNPNPINSFADIKEGDLIFDQNGDIVKIIEQKDGSYIVIDSDLENPNNQNIKINADQLNLYGLLANPDSHEPEGFEEFLTSTRGLEDGDRKIIIDLMRDFLKKADESKRYDRPMDLRQFFAESYLMALDQEMPGEEIDKYISSFVSEKSNAESPEKQTQEIEFLTDSFRKLDRVFNPEIDSENEEKISDEKLGEMVKNIRKNAVSLTYHDELIIPLSEKDLSGKKETELLSDQRVKNATVSVNNLTQLIQILDALKIPDEFKNINIKNAQDLPETLGIKNPMYDLVFYESGYSDEVLLAYINPKEKPFADEVTANLTSNEPGVSNQPNTTEIKLTKEEEEFELPEGEKKFNNDELEAIINRIKASTLSASNTEQIFTEMEKSGDLLGFLKSKNGIVNVENVTQIKQILQELGTYNQNNIKKSLFKFSKFIEKNRQVDSAFLLMFLLDENKSLQPPMLISVQKRESVLQPVFDPKENGEGWELREMFSNIHGDPDSTKHPQYFLDNPPEKSIVIDDDIVKKYTKEAVGRSFFLPEITKDEANQPVVEGWRINPEVLPFVYAEDANKNKPLADTTDTRFRNAITATEDFGLLATAASLTDTVEKQTLLYTNLAHAVVDIHSHEQAKDVLNNWLTTQSNRLPILPDGSDETSLAVFINLDHINKPQEDGTVKNVLKDENEQLLGYKDGEYDKDATIELWRERIPKLQELLSHDPIKLQPYHLRQIKFLSHSVDIAKMMQDLKKEEDIKHEKDKEITFSAERGQIPPLTRIGSGFDYMHKDISPKENLEIPIDNKNKGVISVDYDFTADPESKGYITQPVKLVGIFPGKTFENGVNIDKGKFVLAFGKPGNYTYYRIADGAHVFKREFEKEKSVEFSFKEIFQDPKSKKPYIRLRNVKTGRTGKTSVENFLRNYNNGTEWSANPFPESTEVNKTDAPYEDPEKTLDLPDETKFSAKNLARQIKEDLLSSSNPYEVKEINSDNIDFISEVLRELRIGKARIDKLINEFRSKKRDNPQTRPMFLASKNRQIVIPFFDKEIPNRKKIDNVIRHQALAYEIEQIQVSDELK